MHCHCFNNIFIKRNSDYIKESFKDVNEFDETLWCDKWLKSFVI